MADISKEIAIIKTAIYGEEIRTTLCDALTKIYEDGHKSGTSAVAGEFLQAIVGAESFTTAGEIKEEN